VRALVVGAAGQLGTDLVEVLHAGGHETRAVTRAEVDITNRVLVDHFIAHWATGGGEGVVFNCAAYTDVDGAESDEAGAHLVNAVGPANLAIATATHGADLVHVSTDYVFDGTASTPYAVDAPIAPRSVYGKTKLAGEEAVRALSPRSYVGRTAWVYGATGSNFVKTMARLESERDTLSVVDDQVGSPTWSRDLAEGLVALAQTRRYGTYHCTNAGETTWCGFARAVFEELGADPMRVAACTTADFPRPAPRPAYSVLSDSAWREAGLPPMRSWRDALAAAFATNGTKLRAHTV
jgi:dTDP-4-dehydrorhamnose reductase